MHQDDVHLWSARLDLTAEALRPLAASLTDAEYEHAAAQHLPHERDRLIAARGILRAILGHYLGQPPAEVRLRVGPFGKPELDCAAPAPLHFNLAHSGGIALFAVSKSHMLGVDIERVRAEVDYAVITAEFFTVEERAALATLPEPRRLQDFFTRWVCKEAYLKARGLGHSLPLASVQVDLAGWLPRFSALDEAAGDPEGWSLREIAAEPGFVAALVVGGSIRQLVPYIWNSPRLQIGNSALL